MANVFRGPLIVGKGDPPVQQAVEFSRQSLLVTTLAVAGIIPLPLSAAHSFPLQNEAPSLNLFLNADTSHGTPKTLIADGVPPVKVAPWFGQNQYPANGGLNASTTAGMPPTLRAPPAPFFVSPHFNQTQQFVLNGDTGRGTPKTLIADQIPPVKVAPWFGQVQHPAVEWLNPNTTAGTISALLGPPKPFFVAPNFSPVAYGIANWLNPDTSRGYDKELSQDQIPPGMVAPFWKSDQVLVLDDTSQSTPDVLRGVIFPIANAPFIGQIRYWWQPQDTSFSSVEFLLPTGVKPVVNTPFIPADFERVVEDTSQETTDVLRSVISPVVNPPFWKADQRLDVADTSKGTSTALLPIIPPSPVQVAPFLRGDQRLDVVDTTRSMSPVLTAIAPPPPLAVAPFLRADQRLDVFDTSHSTPKTLLAETALPFQVYQFTPADRVRPVADTSRSSYGTYYPPAPPFPVGKTIFLSPQQYVWQVINTSYGQSLTNNVSERAYTFIGFTFITG